MSPLTTDSAITYEDLRRTYADLCTPPRSADASWYRRRGFRFERLLSDLLRLDGLDPRTSYKAHGEQIDGSLFLDGTIFLLEAKWHKQELPASSLYEFKGKVDGKLVGTIGLFLSMSGYSDDAVDALVLGKSLNLILFNKPDIDAAINRELGFKSILKIKLRQAAEEGVVYFPIEADVVTSNEKLTIEIERLGYDVGTGELYTQQPVPAVLPDLVVICEGTSDRELIAHLAKRILTETGSAKAIKIAVSMGKHSAPRLANAIHDLGSPRILIVIDGDGDEAGSLEMLKKRISFDGWKASIPNPAIESWLGIERRSIKTRWSERIPMLLKAANEINLAELRSQDKSFATFYTALTET